MKKVSKVLTMTLALVGSLVMFGISSFAAQKSWNANLGWHRGKTFLEKGQIVNTSDSVKAKVTYMGGGYNRMYFYLTTSKGSGPSSNGTINSGFVAVPDAPGMNKGATVELHGGNDKWSYVTVDASGYVIFP